MGVKLIYISSSQRVDYNTTTSNNFKLYCADSLYGAYRLKAISIPNTVYTIDAGINNTFFIEIYNNAGVLLSRTNIIMASYYISDGATLATLVQDTINAAIPIYPFTVSYDDNTSKLIFTNATNPFKFDLSSNYDSPLNSIIGFGKGIFNSNPFPGASPAYTLSSQYIVNLTRTPTLFISIAECNNYLQIANTGKTYTFMIPNNVNSLYFIDSFFDQTAIFNQFSKELNITLRDDKNRIVDIQNIDWYMVLESMC